MQSQGFTRTHEDCSLYVNLMHDSTLITLLFYVDDMLTANKPTHNIPMLKAQLNNCFDMKDLGAAKHILGM